MNECGRKTIEYLRCYFKNITKGVFHKDNIVRFKMELIYSFSMTFSQNRKVVHLASISRYLEGGGSKEDAETVLSNGQAN